MVEFDSYGIACRTANERAANHQVAGRGDGIASRVGGGTRYLVAAAVSCAPHNDEHVADDGHPCEQPHTEPQHYVGHEVLTRAELVWRRQTGYRSRQTAEPELIRLPGNVRAIFLTYCS